MPKYIRRTSWFSLVSVTPDSSANIKRHPTKLSSSLGLKQRKVHFLSSNMLPENSTQDLQTVNGRKKKLAIVRLTDALYPRMWTTSSYRLHSFNAEKNLLRSRTSIPCIFRCIWTKFEDKENTRNKSNENVRESDPAPDTYTTSDITRALGSRSRTWFSSTEADFDIQNKHFLLRLFFFFFFLKIEVTMILSKFETINWANEKECKNFVSVAL